MHEDSERCVRIVQAKDERFDGFFWTAVVTTGIYCRPSCPVVPPRPKNMRFYPSAAAAAGAGFRACKRCRPNAAPGSPEWNVRADLVSRAMRLIADGVVDRDGVPGLAARLGYSVRQVERHLMAEVGAGPLALARVQRAQSARLLIEGTGLPFTEIALAAGFNSIRSFNETVREVYAMTPGELRSAPRPKAGIRGAAFRAAPAEAAVASKAGVAKAGVFEAGAEVAGVDVTTGGVTGAVAAGTIVLKLPFRQPLCPDNLFGHLAATAVPGVEEWRDGAYRCAFHLPGGHGIAALSPRPDHIVCQLWLTDLRDLTAAISRCRWLLDLDADPVAIDEQLSEDEVLAPLVAKNPGRRVPRVTEPEQFAVRAVLGQQVSTAAARTHAARLVQAHGRRIDDPAGGLTHLFPTSQDLATLDPETLALPRTRRQTLLNLIEALNTGALDLRIGGDWDTAREQLYALPGFGPWTVESIAMRALGDPDAFIPGDLGIRQAAQKLGLPEKPGPLTTRSQAWQPWRAYAVQHLWGTSDHAVNRMPT
ncbi:DNA-3-methyladenine glycosylase 2 family protein [Kineosporia rhizophila]|uniref:DNA-3-methyladenine glycosylase 2 family protein n=1 Tax=Kineosporia rhizophila TaxID=84633 RepID=UPI0022B7ECE8|nr:AlkA N-terminal domain-containing protein [Kineosporia rhizophila]